MGRLTGSNDVDVASGTLSVEHDNEVVRWEAKGPGLIHPLL